MNRNPKRGRSQVLFKYLPGAVFPHENKWYKVSDLKLDKINKDTSHILHQVKKAVNDWSANKGLKTNLYPPQDELFYFAEIEQVNYELFPLVFYCESCKNVHEYYSLNDIEKKNYKLRCQFCKKGNLRQYPYALIHPNGDIKSINVVKNKANNWKDQYNGIRMQDTRRFTTATWYNYFTSKSLGSLGTKITSLPLTEEMQKNNKRFLSGTHLSDGDVHYPALLSLVNLTQETLDERQQNEDFVYVQLAALLGLESIDKNNFSDNFKMKSQSNLLKSLVDGVQNEAEAKIIRMLLERQNLSQEIQKKSPKEQIIELFGNGFDGAAIMEDRLLHEFLFSWYENEGKDIEDKIFESKDSNDLLHETSYLNAKKELVKLGFSGAMLLERFPVLTISYGFTRKTFNRDEAILNPYKQTIRNKAYSIIPVLRNENEAIIFRLDPIRVVIWLSVNQLIKIDRLPETMEHAYVQLFENLDLSRLDLSIIANTDITKIEDDEKLLATIYTFQLIHTLSHMLLNAGKAIIGLDVDSMSEYIFPSALSFAIYVSKMQGGGMGALVAAFDNDLERWLKNTYENLQTCLYDPVCKGENGACHACAYLKYSCQHFNRGLSRNLLINGEVGGRQIIGYFSKKVDDIYNQIV